MRDPAPGPATTRSVGRCGLELASRLASFRRRIELKRGDALENAWSGQLQGLAARSAASGGRRFERLSPPRRRAFWPLVAAVLDSGPCWPAGAVFARDRLIHAEDFSVASTYDSSFWIAETGFFRNKEAQYYRPANVGVRDGALTLEARREPALNAAYDADGADWLTTTKSADYTLGSIVSREAFTCGMPVEYGDAWPPRDEAPDLSAAIRSRRQALSRALSGRGFFPGLFQRWD